jgi:hypothetical protein
MGRTEEQVKIVTIPVNAVYCLTLRIALTIYAELR